MTDFIEEFCVWVRRYKLKGYDTTFMYKSVNYYDLVFDEFSPGDERTWVDPRPYREIL